MVTYWFLPLTCIAARALCTFNWEMKNGQKADAQKVEIVNGDCIKSDLDRGGE